MKDAVLASMLSACAVVSLMVAFVIILVVFMVGVLFKESIKHDKHNIKVIATCAKFIAFLSVVATVLEVVAVCVK